MFGRRADSVPQPKLKLPSLINHSTTNFPEQDPVSSPLPGH